MRCSLDVLVLFYATEIFHFLQSLREQLSNKEMEIEQVRELGTTLMEIEHDMPSSTPGGTITQTCDNLNTQWADLDHKVSDKTVSKNLFDCCCCSI